MSRPRTARQEALSLAATQRRLRQDVERQQEEAARTAPISGTPVGRNRLTGAFQLATRDGGIVEAQSLTTGPLSGELPLQRYPGSERAFVDAPPAAPPDIATLTREIQRLNAEIQRLSRPAPIHWFVPSPVPDIPYTIMLDPATPWVVTRITTTFGIGSGTVTFSKQEEEALEPGVPFTLTFSGLSRDSEDEITAANFAFSIRLR